MFLEVNKIRKKIPCGIKSPFSCTISYSLSQVQSVKLSRPAKTANLNMSTINVALLIRCKKE